MDLRVLTVQQPWAWAILHGGKSIENRSQLWSYRGPLAIHAAGTWSPSGANDERVAAALGQPVWRLAAYRDRPAFVFGAVLGVVELVDVHWATGGPCQPCCPPWGEGLHNGGHGAKSATHLVLADPKPFDEPIPWKGRLGLWRPDSVLAGEIARQLAGGAW